MWVIEIYGLQSKALLELREESSGGEISFKASEIHELQRLRLNGESYRTAKVLINFRWNQFLSSLVINEVNFSIEEAIQDEVRLLVEGHCDESAVLSLRRN